MRLRPPTLLLFALALVMAPLSCAGPKRPVLYPNATLDRVGEAQAQADIDACLDFAAGRLQEHRRAEEALGQGAEGAVVGAAGGAAAGAVTGGSIGRSAGAGAAAGAAIGVVRGLWKGSEPDPLFKRFVEECLREKGYNTVGWD